MQYTKDQLNAMDSLKEFLSSTETQFLLNGFAGTGKTTLLKELSNFYITTPTNKAAKVVRELGLNATTIYSLLEITMKAEADQLILTYPKYPVYLKKHLVVDECSMINEDLYNYIITITKNSGKKVIFIGDSAQLPPIGEKKSKCFVSDYKYKAKLKHIVRTDNNILQLSQEVRRCLIKGELPDFKKFECDEIQLLDNQDFKSAILDNKNEFTKEDNFKLISWRNKTVDKYNNIIRESLNLKEPFDINDRIFTKEPVIIKSSIVASIDEEGTIIQRSIGAHPKYKYKTIYLQMLCDYGGLLNLNLIHPDSQFDFDKDLRYIADCARSSGKLWKDFWELKESFHSLRYSYAMTAHRSQGSTFDTCFIDVRDILANSNFKESLKCLYVAITRAKNMIYLKL